MRTTRVRAPWGSSSGGSHARCSRDRGYRGAGGRYAHFHAADQCETLNSVWDPWPDVDIHLEWGERGASEAADRGDDVVVVDAFRFSTTVTMAVERGARVMPLGRGERAPEDTSDLLTLSPTSTEALPPGERFAALVGERRRGRRRVSPRTAGHARLLPQPNRGPRRRSDPTGARRSSPAPSAGRRLVQDTGSVHRSRTGSPPARSSRPRPPEAPRPKQPSPRRRSTQRERISIAGCANASVAARSWPNNSTAMSKR